MFQINSTLSLLLAILPGIPTTVDPSGTDFKTTEPAPIFEQFPILILPIIIGSRTNGLFYGARWNGVRDNIKLFLMYSLQLDPLQILSITLFSGLNDSSFATKYTSNPLVTLFNHTKGVFHISSVTLFAIPLFSLGIFTILSHKEGYITMVISMI